MASVVETTIEIPASAAEAFAFVDDYRNVPKWMFGLQKFEPVGQQTQGLGATYDGNIKLGVALKSRVKVTAWRQDELIELSSIKGIKNVWNLVFTPIGEDRCRVDVRVTYELPGGPVGAAMGAAVKPLVGVAVTQTSNALVSQFQG